MKSKRYKKAIITVLSSLLLMFNIMQVIVNLPYNSKEYGYSSAFCFVLYMAGMGGICVGIAAIGYIKNKKRFASICFGASFCLYITGATLCIAQNGWTDDFYPLFMVFAALSLAMMVSTLPATVSFLYVMAVSKWRQMVSVLPATVSFLYVKAVSKWRQPVSETSLRRLEYNQKRPVSVTIISWLLIILGVIGFIVPLVLISQVELNSYINLLIFAIVISCVVQIVMGIGMLNGMNWARLLFLWLTPISIIIGIISGLLGGRFSPGTFLKIVWYIIFAIFLTKPACIAYFKKPPAIQIQSPENSDSH